MMEKKLRALLLRLLGFEKYLSLVSDIYIRMIGAGMMKAKYPELFYLKTIIKPGFTCIDIGANVGYYSSFLSRYSGPAGKVFAVEPVALFAKIFRRNTTKFGIGNITLYETALGSEKGKVMMGTPLIDGVLRHGLTSVVSPEHATGMVTYEVPLEVPDHLFANLEKVDFLKCDVEGYEVFLFPHFMKTLERCKPLIQVEISTEENRKKLISLFTPLGYKPHRLLDEKLVAMADAEALAYHAGDF